jgi:peptide/nickel transport system substrate-binding protein
MLSIRPVRRIVRLFGALALPCLAVTGLLVPAVATAQEKSVTIVIPAEPGELEPCQAKANDTGWVTLDNVVETLAVRDIKTGNLEPQLATSWEQVDDLTWRFKLRQGVTFHDGTALNAEAAKKAIDRNMNAKMVCMSRVKFFGDKTLEISVVDDMTIDVKTEQLDPILPLNLSNHPIYSTKGMPMDKKVRGIGGGGTGPYRVAEWAAGQQIVLERNADYWGKKPEVEKATFIWRGESSVATAMVKQGEADLAPVIAPQDVTPELGVAYPNAETTRLNLDLILEPMSDRRVRAAMNYAIDREALKVTVGPEVTNATHMFVPQTAGHNDGIDVAPYNPGLAKALVAAAKADGVDVGREIQFVGRIGHFPGDFDLIQALTAMFNEAGLNVRAQMFEGAQKNKIQAKPFAEGRPPQIVMDQHDNTLGDPVVSMYSRFHSGGGQSKTSDPHIDFMIEYASSATGAERIWAWERTMEHVNTLMPNVMLYHMVGYAAVGPRINFTPTVFTNSAIHVFTITFK